MLKFLKLIRLENVVMVLVTQLLMSYAVIAPILKVNGLESATPALSTLLIILGTALITMGGYVINDYFDTRIDEINKPHKVIIGKAISRHKAMSLHQILTGIGVLCGLFVSYQTRSVTIALIYIMIPGLLWFYSSSYKRQFFIGNVIVGLITGFVPMIMALVEVAYQVHIYGDILKTTGVVADIYLWVGFFSLFAFALNVLREMVKDLQDEEGDREMECRTVPIVLGNNWAKVIITLFTGLLLTAIVFLIVKQLTFAETVVLKNFLLYGVCAPLFFFVLMLFRAKIPQDYATTQKVLKAIMLAGIIFSLVFLYTVA